MSTRTRRLDEDMKIAERDYAGRLKDMQGDFEVGDHCFAYEKYFNISSFPRLWAQPFRLWKVKSPVSVEPR